MATIYVLIHSYVLLLTLFQCPSGIIIYIYMNDLFCFTLVEHGDKQVAKHKSIIDHLINLYDEKV